MERVAETAIYLKIRVCLPLQKWYITNFGDQKPVRWEEHDVIRYLWIAMLCLIDSGLTSTACLAAEKMPPQMQVGEHRLLLNGSGVRTKTFLELYVAGLYLIQPTNNSAAIIAADEPMAIRIKITSSLVSQSSLVESLEDGFKNATAGDTRSIRQEIDQFRKYFQEDIRKGDVFDMVYHPQHGVIVNKNGKLVGVVGGVKFKQALFGIWLSDKPADGALRQALLTSPTVR